MHHSSKSPEEILELLLTGNKRFSSQEMIHPNQTTERRKALGVGQQPMAVIVGCSDSRVSPEIIFDQGLGDLFVVRLAGNIVDDAALGSIEYAVEHLGAKLIMVLGHQSCGAVKASLGKEKGPGHLESVLEPIRKCLKNQLNLDADQAARLNIQGIVDYIKSCEPILKPEIDQGHARVVGAYYSFDTGLVEIV